MRASSRLGGIRVGCLTGGADVSRGAREAARPKTEDELSKLLHDACEKSGKPLGSSPDPQWLEIVPVEDDEKVNWNVAHGPKNPDGDFWQAIEREMPTLQKKYDLKQ